MTSDEFFHQNEETFDIIFIDGLHEREQVYRDIYNSLLWLNQNGTIIVHDLLPTKEEHQIVPRISKQWTGDVWKAWVDVRIENQMLEMFVVDTDWGVGVIRKGIQNLLKINCEINWENFTLNKKEWLHLISPETFVTKASK
jgi:predicted O-methyltransferase YrrM